MFSIRKFWAMGQIWPAATGWTTLDLLYCLMEFDLYNITYGVMYRYSFLTTIELLFTTQLFSDKSFSILKSLLHGLYRLYNSE